MVVDGDGGQWAVSAVSAVEGWQRAWEDGFPSRWLFLLRWLFRGRGHSHSKKPLKMPVRRLDPLSMMQSGSQNVHRLSEKYQNAGAISR